MSEVRYTVVLKPDERNEDWFVASIPRYQNSDPAVDGS